MINSQKLKARIVECNMTQKDVAKALNIATPTLNQKINNIRPMDLNEAEKICKLLHISPSDFGVYFFTHEVA